MHLLLIARSAVVHTFLNIVPGHEELGLYLLLLSILFSRYQGVHTDLSSSWVAVFCIQADDFQEVRVDVDSDTTVDHSPNFNLRTRHCE